jgi:hypothetical protein
LDDITFIKLRAQSIEKTAVLGDKAREDTWRAIFGLFGHVGTSYFDVSEREKAARWPAE